MRRCLYTRTNIIINNIKNLFSHPQSLAQCRKWINNNIPNSKLIPMLSNSEGAIQVKTNNDACIGPNTLSDYYDLTLVESNIQDFENNQTRFLILGKSIHYSLNESKTSIIIFNTSFTFKIESPGNFSKL